MTLRPPLFSPTYTPFPFMARFRSPRQRNAPSIRGFATATSPWLRHREEVRSGLGNHRADLARELLAALGGRLGIARRLAELAGGRSGETLDFADQVRLVVKGVAQDRKSTRLNSSP